MPTVVACKLPHGLTINHNGQTINLNGTNAGSNPLNPLVNGGMSDGKLVNADYGLTQLTDDQAAAFQDWSDWATYKHKDGKPDKAAGQLAEPFLPLVNGAILTFKSMDEARAETSKVSADVVTGFDGLDGDAEIKKLAEGQENLVNSGADKKK